MKKGVVVSLRSSYQEERDRSSKWVRVLPSICVAALLGPWTANAQTGKAPSPSPEVARLATAATEALRKQDYATAIQNLEKATHLAPDVAEFQADLGMAYYWAGRPKDAIGPCQRAVKLKPSLAFACYFLDISLAEGGQCKEALPLLEKDYGRADDPHLKRFMGLDGARCTMTMQDPFDSTNWVRRLNRDFPDDPDVLYLSTRVLSDLSTLTSQHLLRVAPGSYQARQIDAEVLGLQGRNADAIAEYRQVVDAAPRLPGIHYRIGRLLLAGQPDAPTMDAARKEFEAELQLNPNDAGSEYELGEMARASRQWNEAIVHFERAAKIDPNFPEALIGLGKSRVSAGRAAEAVAPLENAVRLAPSEPVAHYQLSFAYLRLGRREEADKQLALYREAHGERQQVRMAIRQGLTGGISKPQTAEPPE